MIFRDDGDPFFFHVDASGPATIRLVVLPGIRIGAKPLPHNISLVYYWKLIDLLLNWKLNFLVTNLPLQLAMKSDQLLATHTRTYND